MSHPETAAREVQPSAAATEAQPSLVGEFEARKRVRGSDMKESNTKRVKAEPMEPKSEISKGTTQSATASPAPAAPSVVVANPVPTGAAAAIQEANVPKKQIPASSSTSAVVNRTLDTDSPPDDQIQVAALPPSSTKVSPGESTAGSTGEDKISTTAPASASNVANTATTSALPTPSTTSSASAAASVPVVPSAPPSAAPAATKIPIQKAPPDAAELPVPACPSRALKMEHLKTKYTGELEYMLREFRKLERQLLGAKGATQIEESAGSRERREKLHSFILHLEDTIRQIELGCTLESEGKSTVNVGVAGPEQQDATAQELAKKHRAESSSLSSVTLEKEEEENVQKLEEHILANLLPVKVRLKKQLAAQQGATKNPAGMPAMRRGSLQPTDSADRGKGTFAAAAEQRRKQAEALAAQQQQQQQQVPVAPVHPNNTHFGKPLGRRVSSLTQKLHGETLGSQGRPHGYGVGAAEAGSAGLDTSNRKIIYGGVAPGSKQVASGVAVASAVHNMVVESPHLQNSRQASGAPKPEAAGLPLVVAPIKPAGASRKVSLPAKCRAASKSAASKPAARPPCNNGKAPKDTPEMEPSATTKLIREKLDDKAISDDERKRLRRKLKKKLLIRRAKRREIERQRQAAIAQSAQVVSKTGAGRKKSMGGTVNGKKRGPRNVEYICSLCSETYSSVCEYNPWWALARHECPKCRKTQIPRIDIGAPANAIEYHPALLAHAEDNGTNKADVAEQAPPAQMSIPSHYPISTPRAMDGDIQCGSDSEFGSDLSDITDGNLSDISLDSDDSDAEVLASWTPAEKAEYERFGFEYKGPKLTDSEAARLLILMLHANGCPCRHKSHEQRDVCRSTKFMMLHVRDCQGTTINFDVCPFPWCRKVKHLLYHLVSCIEPLTCNICSPADLPKGMNGLIGLNNYRLKHQRKRMIAVFKARQQQLELQEQPEGEEAAATKATTQPAQDVDNEVLKANAIKTKGTAQATARTKASKPAANAARNSVGSLHPGTKYVDEVSAARAPPGVAASVQPAVQSAASAPAGATPRQQLVQNPVPVPSRPVGSAVGGAPAAAPATAAVANVAPSASVPAPATTLAAPGATITAPATDVALQHAAVPEAPAPAAVSISSHTATAHPRDPATADAQPVPIRNVPANPPVAATFSAATVYPSVSSPSPANSIVLTAQPLPAVPANNKAATKTSIVAGTSTVTTNTTVTIQAPAPVANAEAAAPIKADLGATALEQVAVAPEISPPKAIKTEITTLAPKNAKNEATPSLTPLPSAMTKQEAATKTAAATAEVATCVENEPSAVPEESSAAPVVASNGTGHVNGLVKMEEGASGVPADSASQSIVPVGEKANSSSTRGSEIAKPSKEPIKSC